MSCETETSSTFASTSEADPPRQSRWTLAFADPELERAYLLDHAQKSVHPLRVAVSVVVVLSSLFLAAFFGLGWRAGGHIEGLGSIPPLASVAAVLTLVTFVAFTVVIGSPRVWPWLRPLTFGCALVWFGVDVPTLGALALPYSSTVTLSALIITYTILRLGFVWATILGWMIVVSHLATAGLTHHLEGAAVNQFAMNALLSVTMNLILMVAVRQLDSSERAAFWRDLSAERRERALRAALAELTEAESRLLEAEREAAQSRLVAGLLHEINNPSSVLRSNLQLWERIQQRLKAAEAKRDREQMGLLLAQSRPIGHAVETSARRVAQALKSLELFVGLDAGSKVRVDVGLGLREAARLVRAQRGTSIEVDAPTAPIELHAHRYRLNQVWVQLIDNAAQAAGTEGHVRARARLVGGHIDVEIEDDGPGMDSEQLESAFRVGFTDAEGQVRFHLGLPMSRRIVREHGGDLELDSKSGQGTRARVRLPRAGS